MSIEFFRTGMGQKFYQADVPEIARQLKRVADALEKLAEEKQEVQKIFQASEHPSLATYIAEWGIEAAKRDFPEEYKLWLKESNIG